MLRNGTSIDGNPVIFTAGHVWLLRAKNWRDKELF